MSQRRLSNWIDSYLEYVDNSEPPLLYKKWVAISTIAACLQRKCWVVWEKQIYPNMYIVLVGPAGARKGTAMGPALDILSGEGGVRLAAESITREALIKEMLDGNTTSVVDANGLTKQHSSMTIWSQELTVFLGYNNPQFISDLTDWYDCRDNWSYRTKHHGEFNVEGVWINLIGATTPDMIQTALPQDAIGGGLTSRIIFVYGEQRHKLVPIPFRTKAEEKLFTDLQVDVNAIASMRGEFKMTPDFIEKRAKWYIEQTNNPPFEDPKFDGYLQRRPTHHLKLCMIFSAARDNSMTLDVEIFDKALELLEETERTMPLVYSTYGRRDKIKVMDQMARRIFRSPKGIAVRELYKTFVNEVAVDEMWDMLQSLEYTGAIRIDRTQGSGNEAIAYPTFDDTPLNDEFGQTDSDGGQ